MNHIRYRLQARIQMNEQDELKVGGGFWKEDVGLDLDETQKSETTKRG